MTDQTNLEYKIRSLIAQWERFTRDDLTSASTHDVLNDLRDLLPPVLPDPLFGARATHPDYGEGIVINPRPYADGTVRFMFPDEATVDGTRTRWVPPSALTFHTPDMSKNAAEIDTSTEHVDPIDTTPEQPQPEDVKPDPQPGEAWLVEYRGKRYEAVYWYSPLYAHWTFSYDGLSTVEPSEATPVSRLVPETPDHPEFLESEEVSHV